MPPVILRLTQSAVETAIVVVLLALGGLIVYDSVQLGSGWGQQGPQPGFFPFILALMMLAGTLAVLLMSVRKPDRQPFFQVSQEVVDLLKVGLPIVALVAAMPWTGLYITSGLYMTFFMAWYGKFRWYQALAGGLALPTILWLFLRVGFNIAMPMSIFYRTGALPF